MAKKMISNFDIDNEVSILERVTNSISFLSAALPEYPHEGGMEEVGTILDCLQLKAYAALSRIKKVASLS
jgi:hypothetical protein